LARYRLAPEDFKNTLAAKNRLTDFPRDTAWARK